MPRLPFGILRQLEVAGFDPASDSLPPVDLRGQLHFQLQDLSPLAIPPPVITRAVRSRPVAIVGRNTVIHIIAATRAFRLTGWLNEVGTNPWKVGVLPTSGLAAIATVDKDDTAPRNVEPQGREHVSVYSSGTTITANLNLGTNDAERQSPATPADDPLASQWPVGLIVPPGFTLVMEGATSNFRYEVSHTWEELGP